MKVPWVSWTHECLDLGLWNPMEERWDIWTQLEQEKTPDSALGQHSIVGGILLSTSGSPGPMNIWT
jgi:hypothetical protein